jgi:hypothetical protein
MSLVDTSQPSQLFKRIDTDFGLYGIARRVLATLVPVYFTGFADLRDHLLSACFFRSFNDGQELLDSSKQRNDTFCGL